MKTTKHALVIMFAILAAFIFTAGAYAQEEDIVELEEFDALDHQALMLRLQTTFRIELQVLEGYVAQGYSPGQLWLALEIARERTMGLDEALVLAEGSDGHGWGLLAQKLGIDPGSAEFHGLKARWTERKGEMLGQLKRNGEGGVKPESPAKPDAPRGSDGSGKPESAGNTQASSGKGPEHSGGNSNSSGQGGKK
ncbi:MAG: hypothetical protein RBT73_03535 [Spirochaetia bacterium]|jgi:hypothetical protein|nr:hypothetical protein [Spirochaetia bacterium]